MFFYPHQVAECWIVVKMGPIFQISKIDIKMLFDDLFQDESKRCLDPKFCRQLFLTVKKNCLKKTSEDIVFKNQGCKTTRPER